MNKKRILSFLILIVIILSIQIYKNYKSEIKMNYFIQDIDGSKIYNEFIKKSNINSNSVYVSKYGLNTDNKNDDRVAFSIQINPKGHIDLLNIVCYYENKKETQSMVERIIEKSKSLFGKEESDYKSYSIYKFGSENINFKETKSNNEYYHDYKPQLLLSELFKSIESIPWEKVFDILKENYPINYYEHYSKNILIANIYEKNEEIPLSDTKDDKKVYYIVNRLGEISKGKKGEIIISDSKVIEFDIYYAEYSLYKGYPSHVGILLEVSEVKNE